MLPSPLFRLPIACLGIALFALLLAACSSDDPEPTPTPARATEAAATEAATATPVATPEPTATAAATAEATPDPTATPSPAMQALAGVRGIVDPTNTGWPREVEGLNGIISIPAKPMRIITASIGHDELTLALVPIERLIAVGAFSKDETYSNVASLVLDKDEITRDPEVLVALNPDVIVTSPFFPLESIEALQQVGIPVIQTELAQGAEERVNTILLMGYIFGEEERAFAFADEVQARYDALVEVTATVEVKPRVLALTQYSDSIWTAGAGSTEGGIITAAGGVNAAEDAGIDGNQTTSLEGVIAMAPDVIIIPQPVAFGAEEFLQSLLENEALAEIPAIANGAVYVVESKHFTTLSHWNLLGAESLARLLWPDIFGDSESAPFSSVE